MNRELDNFLSQLADDDQEIRKLGINGISELDIESLDTGDANNLKARIAPLLEDSNLTIRYFAKKTLKRLESIDENTATVAVVSENQDDNAFFIPMAGQSDLQPRKTASKHTGDDIEVTAEDVRPTAVASAASPAAESPSELSAATEVSDDSMAEKAPVEKRKTAIPPRKGKPITKTVAGGHVPCLPSFPAQLAAWINILFFLGLAYESLHFKILDQGFPKMITSDLQGQVIFGLVTVFGLTNLFLRSRITAMGSSRLAAVASTATIALAYHINPAALQILGADANYLAATLPVIAGVAGIGFLWENGTKWKILKIPFSLIGIYGISGSVLHLSSGINAIPTDPFLLDSGVMNAIASAPPLAAPTYVLVHFFMPVVLLRAIWELLAGLFTLDSNRFITSSLAMTLFTFPLIIAFFTFPAASTRVYNVRDALESSWSFIHEKSGQPLLKPPAWLKSTEVDSNSSETPALIPVKTEKNGNDASTAIESEPQSKPGTESNDHSANDSSKEGSLEKIEVPAPTDPQGFVDFKVKSFMAQNNSILSKDQFTGLKSEIAEEHSKALASLKVSGKSAVKLLEEGKNALNIWEKKLFEGEQAQSVSKDEEGNLEKCQISMQKIGAAVESFNFNQPSENVFMKNLDFNQLYPKHLTDGIPLCPSGGSYSLDGNGHPACSHHGVLSR
ncbi:MAG: hypothetical protein CVV64_09590 [Candidatus Wallbacteria bacterium HGW-Wallbacteria-1]|uniref:Uncharacterized protein n=1 Tax=Candidatus Wallbacteria bacterium HGW-Wallbacteria-1 TaxID=2013854 RepID=A0A2N1PQJ4_9BACT|nr:MAG: hypothetical protein CVV64_09590 [Candidatus Wallbacteria bacterium HGW-Wallbacteria-1]